MKRFLSFLVFLTTFAFAQDPSCLDNPRTGKIWDGTINTDWYNGGVYEPTYIVICTAEELAGLASLTNMGMGFDIKLGADILLNDTTGWQNWDSTTTGLNQWIPIGGLEDTGNPGNGFYNNYTATFDGNGYVVSGMYINDSNYFQGLFGIIGDNNIGVRYGAIKNLGVTAFYVKGNLFVGGLTGSNYGTISNSYSMGTVAGGSYMGGSIGGLTGNNNGTISNSYSMGTVTGGSYIGVSIGGLTGDNNGTISNSYSMGTAGTRHFGDFYNIGGLIGSNNGTISNNYSIGTVETDSVYIYSLYGGLVGYINLNNSITNSYYNTETSSQTDIGKGEGKTTAEMKEQSTYEGWDFNYDWHINSCINDGYLFLINAPFYIEPRNSQIQITLKNQRQKFGNTTTIEYYSSDFIKPAVESVIYNGTALSPSDYDVLYFNNKEISDTARIIILGKGVYCGLIKSLNFIITNTTLRDISKASIDRIFDQIWTGSAIRPEFIIRERNFDGVQLTRGVDYTVSFKNNIDIGENTAEATIFGTGIYDGSQTTVTFSIVDSKKLTTENTEITLEQNVYNYDDIKHTPQVTEVRYTTENIVLTEGTDYTVSYGDNVNAPTGTVIITGIGIYGGTVENTFAINPKNLSQVKVAEIPMQEYTGEAITPELTIMDSEKLLILDTDYTVQYYDNIDITDDLDYPGRANITGKGNYTGSRIVNFIIGSEIERIDIAVNWLGTSPFIFEYNGQPQCPKAIATRPDGAPVAINVTCETVNVGDYQATASLATTNPAYNLTNITADYSITQAPITALLNIYNINENETLNKSVAGNLGNALVAYWYSADKTGTYAQTEPQTEGIYYAYAVVPPTTNYFGATTDIISFAIYKSSIAATAVPVSWTGPYKFTYSGSEQNPAAYATLGGVSFPIEVSGAADVGTHTARANFQTERLDYRLTNAEVEFEIEAKELAEDAVGGFGNFLFTGMQIKPEGVIVKDDGKTLIEGIHYMLSYGENISGTGSVTATGVGNYTGKSTRYFSISNEDAAIVSIIWDNQTEFEYNGEIQFPQVTSIGILSADDIEIIGKQINAGSHSAVVQLKTPRQDVILTNATMPYTIYPKPLTVTWTGENSYKYNKMVQGPIPSVEEANVDLGYILFSEAGTHKPFAQIISENKNNYVLTNESYRTEYIIDKKELKPYFNYQIDEYKSKLDTLWLAYEIFSNPDALQAFLEEHLDYSGFVQKDEEKGIEESDDESLLTGNSRICVYSPNGNSYGKNKNCPETPPVLGKRVETKLSATANINAANISAKNYLVKEVSVVIMSTIEDDDNAEKISCKLGNLELELSAETCEIIGGTNGETPIAKAPIYSAQYKEPRYYNLLGQPLGINKPVTSGIYIEKRGKDVRKIVVK